MPVSLERLIVEVEPAVVTDDLIRDCIVVTGDPESAEEKKQSLAFNQVECVSFSFRNLAGISNLWGLTKLVKLQLDNNHIQKIENLEHLTNLTWLDLSFNRIRVIEGLSTLTKLQDLSMFNNEISTIEGLDNLPNLNVLSLGSNSIARLESVSYLVKFTNLQLLNLAGNPLAKDTDYRSYVLSHLKHLNCLDYRRVKSADRTAAEEQHQDEMQELREREEAAAAEKAAASEKAAHAAAMADANLTGVDTLLEDMTAADPEWSKLLAIPGLLEPWNDVREKWQVATDEFKVVILGAHTKKKEEQADFKAALTEALTERDEEGKQLLVQFEKAKKQLLRAIAAAPGDTEEQTFAAKVLGAKVKLMSLQESLLSLEMDAVEVVGQLVTEFDRCYSEMAEANKLQYNQYFTHVRDLQNNFFAGLMSSAPSYLERYGSAADNPELEALPEEVGLLLGDKDALNNALQTSHEAHISVLDALEDRLVGKEIATANSLADANNAWQEQRHRDRMSELLSYLERNMQDLDALAADAADAAAEAGDAP